MALPGIMGGDIFEVGLPSPLKNLPVCGMTSASRLVTGPDEAVGTMTDLSSFLPSD